MFNYPYGQSQELNLTWLLTSWRQFQEQIEQMIAPQYSETITYPANSIVIHEHGLFRNPAAITSPSEWDPESWESISVADLI